MYPLLAPLPPLPPPLGHQDERVRLSEELAGIKDQLRAAGDSQRRKAALTTQVSYGVGV
jgi:hypothetical protein